MLSGLTTPFRIETEKCEVCGTALTYPDRLASEKSGRSVCHSAYCKQILSQKPNMTPALFNSYRDSNIRLRQQNREKEQARRKHIEAFTAKESIENKKAFKSVLKQNPDLSKSDTHWLVIPSGHSTLSLLSDERVNNYREHLMNIVAEAETFSNVSEVPDCAEIEARENRLLVDQKLGDHPDLHTLSDRLCEYCKGGCCINGKDHAYLTVYSMRCYMDAHPELTASDIFNLYDIKMNVKTYNDSCINHTVSGCALPEI